MASDITLRSGMSALHLARSTESSLFGSFVSALPSGVSQGKSSLTPSSRSIRLTDTPRVGRIVARAPPSFSSDGDSDGAGVSSSSSSAKRPQRFGSLAGGRVQGVSNRALSPQRPAFPASSASTPTGASANPSGKVSPPAAHGSSAGVLPAAAKESEGSAVESVHSNTILKELGSVTGPLARGAVVNGGRSGGRKQQPRGRGRGRPAEQGPVDEDVRVEAGGDVASYIATYNRWIRLGGRLDACLTLLEQMNELGLFEQKQIYHNLFFATCKSERAVSAAFRFVSLLESSGGAQLSAYNQLMAVCAHCADVQGATKVLRLVSLSPFRPDTALYTALIAACCRAAKLELAFKVYHDMESALVPPNVRTFATLIDGCAKQGHVAKAFGAYGMLRAKHLRPDLPIFNSLITACGRAGSWERAFDVLADMRAEGHEPDQVTMGAVIAACAACGQSDRALEVYSSLRLSGVPPSLRVSTAAVHACSQGGDWDRAMEVYGHMRDNKVKPDEILFSALIDVAAHANKPDAATALLDDMRREGVEPGAVTYAALMGMYSRLGLPDSASLLYSEVKSRRAESKLQPTVSMFNALITTLCAHGSLPSALSVLSDMRGMGLKPDKTTYAVLLTGCKDAHLVPAAFDLFHSAQVDGVRIGHAICDAMIEICLHQHRSGAPRPSFSFVIGHLPMAFDLRHPNNDWAECALAVYRQSVAEGVIPTLNLLSKLFGLLRVHDANTAAAHTHTPTRPNNTTSAAAAAAAGSSGVDPHLSPYSSQGFSSGYYGSPPSSSRFRAPAAAAAALVPGDYPLDESSHSAFHSPSYLPDTPMPSFYAVPLPVAAAFSMSKGVAAAAAAAGLSSGAPPASSLADVFALYEPLAYAIYEEAEELGAVPVLSSSAGPISLRFTGYPQHLAEVCMLVLLRGLLKKHRAAPGLKIFPVALHLPVDQVEVKALRRRSTHTINVASRTSQSVASLLRRLGLPYFGYESSGVLRITANAIERWLRLQPHAPISVPLHSMDSSSSMGRVGLPIASRGIGSGILQQQRAIRMRTAAGSSINQQQLQQQQRERRQQELNDSAAATVAAAAGPQDKMVVGAGAVRRSLQRWSPSAQLAGKKWERQFAGWESDEESDSV